MKTKNKTQVDSSKQVKNQRISKRSSTKKVSPIYVQDGDDEENVLAETLNDVVDREINKQVDDFFQNSEDADELDNEQKSTQNVEKEDVKPSSSSNSSQSSKNDAFSPSNAFFYTNDKFISSFEDDEIVEYIQQKFPMFKALDVDDIVTRKTIIEILNDAKFMTKLLEHYDITVFDFIKFLYRQESSVFRGQFIKRIQKALKYKKYVVAAKKQAFRYSPKRRIRHSSKR